MSDLRSLMLSNNQKNFKQRLTTFDIRRGRKSRAGVEVMAVFLCASQKAAVLNTLIDVNPQMQFVGFIE